MIRLHVCRNAVLASLATLSLLATDRAAAVPSGPVTQVAAAYRFSCALTTGDGVTCWGYNVDGELGDNTGSDSPVPVDVQGLTSGVAAIAVGQSHACALTTGGGVKCWGDNFWRPIGRQLGHAERLTPSMCWARERRSSDRGGPLHTCALTVGGGMKCWG